MLPDVLRVSGPAGGGAVGGRPRCARAAAVLHLLPQHVPQVLHHGRENDGPDRGCVQDARSAERGRRDCGTDSEDFADEPRPGGHGAARATGAVPPLTIVYGQPHGLLAAPQGL